MTLIVPETENNSKTKRHSVLVYHKEFKKKPDAKTEVGQIHNNFKRDPNLDELSYTLNDIVNEFCKGKTLMLASVQRELRNQKNIYKAAELNPLSRDWADLHELNFKSTTIVGIDIDDEYSETNAQQVIEHFEGKVSAAYYSFSHGRVNDLGGTENRYRLLFQLDEPLTDYEAAKELVVVLRDELLELYPDFSPNKIDTMQPKTLWHGSSRSPIYVNEDAFLNVKEYMVKVGVALAAKREAYELRQKRQKESFDASVHNPIMFDELLEMAHAIGHIPTESGRYDEWIAICHMIKSHEWSGGITENEGLQLFRVISGGESDDKDYFKLKPNGELKIGSFIKHAVESHGYKRTRKYSYAQQDTPEAIEVERVKVDTYLNKELVIEWLERKQRLIIDSPTGSGKTTAALGAFKQLESSEYKYFIFAAPTIALAEQIALKHDVTVSKGGINGFENYITSKAISGTRIYVTTYNKAAIVVDCLTNKIDYGDDVKPEFYLVVDEAHEYVSSYGFRPEAIESLAFAEKSATSFLALSGTPKVMLKDDYDKLIKVDNGVKGSPCMDFHVLTYHTRKVVKEIPFKKSGGITEMLVEEEEDTKLSDAALVKTIMLLLKKVRVICYINSTKRIERVARLLRKEGFKVTTVNKDEKQSPTYRNIVENEAIGDDVEVVLTTIVLATGITIKNERDSKWACMVACDNESRIFSPSLIKQISHRFRSRYKHLVLYMREQDPEGRSDKPFFVESAYQYKLQQVESHVKYLNEQFDEGLVKDFIPSTVEKQHGIFYKSSIETARIEFNKKNTRYMASRDKENYYNGNRVALIKEVEREIGCKLSGITNVNEELRLNGVDLGSLLDDLQEEKDKEKLDSDELRKNFSLFFNPEVHENLIYRYNEPAIERFKDSVHPDHFTTALRVSNLADYESARMIVNAVKNRTDTNKYVGDIRALCELAAFDYVKKVTVTEKISRELLKYCSVYHTSADFKELIELTIPKKLKVTKNDVKAALKLFHKSSARPGGVAHTFIKPLSILIVSKARHISKQELYEAFESGTSIEVSEDAIKNSLLKYIATRSKQQQNILFPAVAKKYGAIVENNVTFKLGS